MNPKGQWDRQGVTEQPGLSHWWPPSPAKDVTSSGAQAEPGSRPGSNSAVSTGGDSWCCWHFRKRLSLGGPGLRLLSYMTLALLFQLSGSQFLICKRKTEEKMASEAISSSNVLGTEMYQSSWDVPIQGCP